jgi:osmotically-inducible protein OsmY
MMMTKTDIQLKQDIDDELRWDPKVNAAQIGVSVDKGAVSLKGEVDTYAEKWAAEDATKRVSGVRSVAEDLKVKVRGTHKHSDTEIAEAALRALKWDVWVPETVTVNVVHGEVTLEGSVQWNFERNAAERAVRNLAGVVNVFNGITIKAGASATQVHEKVKAALQRQATADANTIQVATSGGKVTLSGNASSWHAIEDARDAAWAAPGVTQVIENVAIAQL